MEKYVIKGLGLAIAMVSAMPVLAIDNPMTSLVEEGKVYGDFRLRFEYVDQDNALDDAKALTLRSRLGFESGSYQGFSGVLEFEDSRPVAGVEDYNSTLNGETEYSVVADPRTTELDQGYLQYKLAPATVKLGRQVLTYDNQRFVGPVGWRQDRQTFDAARLTVTPIENLSLDYAYIGQRNRIFAEARDIQSKDNLVNIGYATPFGKLSAYAYLLEVDNDTDNSLNTYGIRFAGNYAVDEGVKVLYEAEYATQKNESGSSDANADYYLISGGAAYKGIKATVGYEVLGTDDGNYGFSTPLATLHKFNGWADQFLATPTAGLNDLMVTVAGPLAGGKWTIAYHSFGTEEDVAGNSDLGSEIDVAYDRKFAEYYSAGIKFASYMAGDDNFGKVDTNKLWLTLGAAF